MHHRYDPSIMFHQSARVFVGPGTLTAKPPQPTPSICVAADSLSQPLNLLPACIIYTHLPLLVPPQHLQPKTRGRAAPSIPGCSF